MALSTAKTLGSAFRTTMTQPRPQRSTLVVTGSSIAPKNSFSNNGKDRFGILSIIGVKALSATKTLSQRVAGLSGLGTADAQDINAQIKDSVKSMRMLAMVIPFAAVSGSTDTFFIITKAVASFIKLYLLLLFVRVLLSWFPTFTKWEEQPWLALRQVTDPYLKLFSGLVPPLLGTIDLTPLFGFFILQFLGGALDVTDDESKFWP